MRASPQEFGTGDPAESLEGCRLRGEIRRPRLQRNERPEPCPKRPSSPATTGDKVQWDQSQGTTTGHVVRKQTSHTRIKGQGGRLEGQPRVHREIRQDRSARGAQAGGVAE